MQTTTSITLDIARPYFPPTIHAKQYDSDTRIVAVSITDNGMEWAIPECIGVVNIQKPDGKVCFYEYLPGGEKAVYFDGNVATFTIAPDALTTSGEAYADLSLYNGRREKITTFLFRLAIEKAAVPDDTITSANYYNILTQEIAAAIAAAEQVTGLAGFRILGYYDTEDALAEAVPNPQPGDAYGVGTSNPHDIYVWDGVSQLWKNNGPMKGEQGPVGAAAGFGVPEAEAYTVPENEEAKLEVVAKGEDTEKIFIFRLGVPRGEKGETGADGKQGEPGEPGKDFVVRGYYETADALSSSVVSPSPGDAYGVGSSAPYDIYIWDGANLEWVNNGPLQGAQGPEGQQGPPGVTFTPSMDEAGNLSWENNGGLPNPPSKNLMGPTGPQGEPGEQGQQGQQGMSAYASAQSGGYSGTEAEFYSDLAAMDGMAAWFAGY